MSESVCYRHPEREAYVRCQRCDRLICPECQTEAAVGFLCLEDAYSRSAAPRRFRVRAGGAPVTLSLVTLSSIIWLLQIMPGSTVTDQLAFTPLGTLYEPWRLVTAAFVHDPSSPLHLLLNMYSVFIFGRILEPMLGRGRFLALYLISAIGGSLAVLILSPLNSWVVGASTACFGLMAAYFVIARKLGASSGQLLGLIAINLAFGFLVPGISWQGHLGGLVAGGLLSFIYVQTTRPNQRTLQVILTAVFAGVILVLAAGIAYLRFYFLG